MPALRLMAVVSVAILCASLVVGCTGATAGWTYQPAPPITPAPSVEASATPASSGGSGAGSGSDAIAISANGIAFEQTAVDVPAGKAFQIAFDNKDAGTPHNVAVHKDSATGAEVFKGDIVTGPDTVTYDVPALDAGTYAFVCTVHPNMTGTLTAQ